MFLTVHRSKEHGIHVERLEEIEAQIENLLPNTILSSPIFGLQDIFPATHESSNRIRTEDTYNEVLVNDKLVDRLKQYRGTDLEAELKSYLQEKTDTDEKE